MNNRVITFGCRLNIYESEVIKKALENTALENSIVFNTCAVTKEAERKVRQSIRKYKRQNPDARIIVTGCASQINPDFYKNMKEVDQVLGNIEKLSAHAYQQNDHIVSDIMDVKETATHMVSSFEGKARAFIQIQNGCNHRCTFCTIPYGRGPSRSVPLSLIAEQIQTLLQNDVKEFVITGVDITDYGLDIPGQPSLGQTLKRLLDLVPDLSRLRLSSLDPSEMDSDLWDLIEKDPRLLPHLHLSLQSGDDMILKRMKRRHLRHHIIEFIERARSIRSNITLGADIIAGFPTETEEMFENTVKIVEQLDLLHIFPFSSHENTPASRMPQLPKGLIKERAGILGEEKVKCYQRLLKKWVGKSDIMLVEQVDNGVVIGKTDHFIPVVCDGGDDKIESGEEKGDKIKSGQGAIARKTNYEPGQIVEVQINDDNGRSLVGCITWG